MVFDPRFTPIFNTSVDSATYNISYMYASGQSPLMAPPEVFFFCLIAGIILLLVSAFLPLSVCSDLAAAISSGFLLLSSIYAWAVDTVTAYGAVALVVSTAGAAEETKAVLMENHVIYHYDLLGYFSAILLVISFLNLYRLWLDYKRITEQEQQSVEKMPREVEGMKDVREEDERENNYRKSMPNR